MKEQVLDFLKDYFGTDNNNPETFKDMFQSLDSLDAIDLVYRVEEKFNVKVDESIKIESVDDLVKIVELGKVAA